MVRGYPASIGASVTLALLVLTGPGMCAEPSARIKKAKEAIRFQGGRVTTYINPDTLEEEEGEALPALGASTIGLLGSPGGQGPLLAASALFPGRAEGHYTVTFANSDLTDARLVCLKDSLKEIDPKRLDLRFTSVTGTQPGVNLWQDLVLPNLVDLDLSSTLVECLPSLKNFHKLKYLRLANDRLRYRELDRFIRDESKICPCQGIHLYLSRASLIDLKPIQLPDGTSACEEVHLTSDCWLTRLVQALALRAGFCAGLDVSNNGISNQALKSQSLCRLGLAEVSLAGNNEVQDDGIAFLKQYSATITNLNLSGTKVTGKGLASIDKCSGLKRLALSGINNLSDAGLVAILTKNRSIVRLDLSGTPTVVTPDLQEAIGKLEHLVLLCPFWDSSYSMPELAPSWKISMEEHGCPSWNPRKRSPCSPM